MPDSGRLAGSRLPRRGRRAGAVAGALGVAAAAPHPAGQCAAAGRCWWPRCCISTSTRTACCRPRCRAARAGQHLRRRARRERGAADRPPTIRDLVPDIARPLLRRLTEPTPDAQAKLYGPDGTMIADSPGARGAERRGDHRAAAAAGRSRRAAGHHRLALRPGPGAAAAQTAGPLVVDITPGAAGTDWQPDVKEELRLDSAGQSQEMPPYIRRTRDNRLLVTVAEPVERDNHTVGIVLLTREAREVDDSLFAVRLSILGAVRPGAGADRAAVVVPVADHCAADPAADRAAERRCARARAAPAACRRRCWRGATRSASWPAHCRTPPRALWARMDAIEHFAADVAHEIKNPLTSIRSAIETLRRIEDPAAAPAPAGHHRRGRRCGWTG